MLAHYFKLIWNRKRQNFLLFIEILVAFLVVFGVFSSIVYYYNNYKRPMGFDYNNVWTITFTNHETDTQKKDSLVMLYEAIRNRVEALPEVEAMTYTSENAPFTMNVNGTDVKKGTLEIMADDYTMDERYEKVLKPEVLEGNWFSPRDNGRKLPPVVLNETSKEKLFPEGGAVGKMVTVSGKEKEVIGVIRDLKDKGDYNAPFKAVYSKVDSNFYDWVSVAMIRVSPSADAAFESRLYKTLNGLFKGASIEIEHLSEKRVVKNGITVVPLIIWFVVAGFLIVNVALGLFGVLWYNISLRRQEIGLRRAIGATSANVSRQVVTETLVLSALSLLLGGLFAVQFPLLHLFDLPSGVYVTAIFLAMAFILLLVMLCAVYPGKVASGIQPAVALHED